MPKNKTKFKKKKNKIIKEQDEKNKEPEMDNNAQKEKLSIEEEKKSLLVKKNKMKNFKQDKDSMTAEIDGRKGTDANETKRASHTKLTIAKQSTADNAKITNGMEVLTKATTSSNIIIYKYKF